MVRLDPQYRLVFGAGARSRLPTTWIGSARRSPR
jgi:hypothetical protein